ncbi:MAG: hypothetical protein IAG13_09470 [Deltaproteobacteria bacterium]|nr:hypothetical protein [Nannocystaceae bacterium]
MRRIQISAWCGLALAVGLSSCVVTIEPDPNHCMHNDGDAFCVEQHTKKIRPFCGYASCDSSYGDGCVLTRPVEDACYSPCGGGKSLAEDPSCEPPVMTTATAGESSETGAPERTTGSTETGASETTTEATQTGSSEGSSGVTEGGLSETMDATQTGTSETAT